jgi:threonine aldolase
MVHMTYICLQFAGVMARTIQNNDDGTFDLDELCRVIRPVNDVHQPITKLICLENSQNFCGGKALPLSHLKQVLVYHDALQHYIIVN